MRITIVFILVLFAACKSSTESGSPPDGPAVWPKDSSQFVYSYDGFDSTNHPVHLTEIKTIHDGTSKLYVWTVSDTVRRFSTTGIDSFTVMANGDLVDGCGCDTLPIGSHRDILLLDSVPLKDNGNVGEGKIKIETSYAGEETVSTGNESFDCTKIRSIATVTATFQISSLDSSHTTIHNYWYSSKLAYLVKEQVQFDAGNNPNSYIRILQSHR